MCFHYAAFSSQVAAYGLFDKMKYIVLDLLLHYIIYYLLLLYYIIHCYIYLLGVVVHTWDFNTEEAEVRRMAMRLRPALDAQ